MKKVISLLMILVTLLLTGCWDQAIYERIGFMLLIGVETSEGSKKIRATYTTPTVSEEKERLEIISVTSNIIREARETSARVAPRNAMAGKIQEILFSEELSKKGISKFLDVFERDFGNPLLAWIVITEESPSEIIKKSLKFNNKPILPLYINNLLESNFHSANVPETRVFNFDIDYFSPGIDPMAPIIKLMPEEILVTGTALFRGDKMVGKINTSQTSLILAMKNEAKNIQYIIPPPETYKKASEIKTKLAVTLKLNKRKLDVKIKNNKPIINILLNFDGSLNEYTWDNLSDITEQKKVEKYIEDHIKNDCMKTIKYIQDVGSDPIGIGDIVRAKHNNYWNSISWSDAYKKALINVDVNLDIKTYGTIN